LNRHDLTEYLSSDTATNSLLWLRRVKQHICGEFWWEILLYETENSGKFKLLLISMKLILGRGVAWKLSRVMHSGWLSIRGVESLISTYTFLVT